MSSVKVGKCNLYYYETGGGWGLGARDWCDTLRYLESP